jgi:hypothetical protein
MINRRTSVCALFFGLLSSSCATAARRGPAFSLSQALSSLPSINTTSELIEQFGEPNFSEKFNHDDHNNEYLPNRDSRAKWKLGVAATPHHLIDELPVGTRLLLYAFYTEDSVNPTSCILIICVNDNDKIIGWIYDDSAVSHEEEYWVRH